MIKLAKHNELLTQPTNNFDFKNPQMDPKELADLLIKNLLHFNGNGVSANQIGLPYRVFVLNTDPKFVCFNPIITTSSDELIVLEETCLSHPGIIMKVKRPKMIRVRFQDPIGNFNVEKFTGISARVYQQQHDLIDGITFFKRANRYHKEAAIKKWTKDKNYGIIDIIRETQMKLLNETKETI
jgi:peptide deformylase